LGYGIIKKGQPAGPNSGIFQGKAMQEMTLTLLEAEVKDIINVLNQLPTGSGAWPLVQKIASQLPQDVQETVQ
jgi:hypothetical protein